MGFLNKLFSGNAGMCGKNLRWELSGDTLTISGTGEMENYNDSNRRRGSPSPWYKFNDTIRKIVINEGVNSIGNFAFVDFVNLSDVTIPDSVTKISIAAFGDCISLMEIKIPDYVTTIGYSAFCRCAQLTNITIPKSVISIGENIFNCCTRLKEIHYPAGRGFEKNLSQGNNAKLIPYSVAPPVTQPIIQAVTELKFHPVQSTTQQLKFYPAQPTTQQPKFYPAQPTTKPVAEKLTWQFAGKTLTVGGVREIKFFPYAQIPWIDHLHDVQKIVIGNGVEKIAAQTFIECPRLEILELPASVKTIGDCAFKCSYCGDRFVNGGKNVFWCLEDNVLVLKKNPDAQGKNFSTGDVSWIFAEKNIRGIKVEDGVKPTEKFFEWMAQQFDGKEISFK